MRNLLAALLIFVSLLPGLKRTAVTSVNWMIYPSFDPTVLKHATPVPPTLTYSVLRTGVFDVAKVFGKTPSCADADADFIYDVNDAANKAGVPPRLLASTIATESGCNQFATSSRGAIGLTQVLPVAHKTEYDFSKINLLNRKDNLRVGAEILAGYIKKSGSLAGGVTRYQGLAVGCASCNDHYTADVLHLAGK